MHIFYHEAGDVLYARLGRSVRSGNKVSKESVNLGRVIDKEKGVYINRTRGIFRYNLATDTYSSLPAAEAEDYMPAARTSIAEKAMLDFGDSFLLDSFIKQEGLNNAIDAVGYENLDTLYSMICYYILSSTANCHAADWYAGNYAGILYPNAKMSGQRISEFLAAVGDEHLQRRFFGEYLTLISDGGQGNDSILIDSTGLPNSIHFPLTAISNHNGDISNEVRLIYVTQQSTGLPIYFRYCAGNVLDVSTLIRTIKELKEYGVNTKFAILDAGYYSGDNIDELYGNGVSFVTRLRENLKLYKQLVAENLSTLESRENLVSYNARYAYIKCVQCKVGKKNNPAYAYIGLDIDRKGSESRKLFKSAKARNLTEGDVHDMIQFQGIFILVSSRRIAKDKILPTYYTRQQIEQIFDIGKNYADMLPLRVQNEDTFKGHLLLTFIASVIVKRIQDRLLDTVYNPVSMFMNLRNQKCKVYDDKVITQEATKKANDCYKLFDITCPVEIQR